MFGTQSLLTLSAILCVLWWNGAPKAYRLKYEADAYVLFFVLFQYLLFGSGVMSRTCCIILLFIEMTQL